MKIIAVIPARMNSSRFPGKPLARIGAYSMIEHVTRRTTLCRELAAVYVATCDEEIKTVVEQFGGKVIMTSERHERAADRVAEAAAQLECDVVAMVQGDEPLITPPMIVAALAPLREDPSVECVNLVRAIEFGEEFENVNVIKVVTDLQDNAVYFSRAAIPAIDFSAPHRPKIFKQVCVIPFRRAALLDFAQLAPTPLEQAESIDMLRLIEHNRRVRLVEIEENTQAVDTPDDLRLVEALMRTDSLVQYYGTNARR